MKAKTVYDILYHASKKYIISKYAFVIRINGTYAEISKAIDLLAAAPAIGKDRIAMSIIGETKYAITITYDADWLEVLYLLEDAIVYSLLNGSNTTVDKTKLQTLYGSNFGGTSLLYDCETKVMHIYLFDDSAIDFVGK